MVKAVAATMPVPQVMAYRVILSAGLLCGVMDLTAAFVNSGLRGTGPVRVLQYIAAGWLGPASFNGGFASAALGFISHFLVAFSAATVFYGASRKLDFLTEHAVISGIVYGVVVYFLMSRIVVPLSGAPRLRFSVVSLITGLGIHMVCVGMPISLTTRWYSR